MMSPSYTPDTKKRPQILITVSLKILSSVFTLPLYLYLGASDMDCIALLASVPCKSLISLWYSDRRQRDQHGQFFSFNVPFSNLIGNRLCGFAIPHLSTLLMCSRAHSSLTEQLIQQQRQLFDPFFFALMPEMSLQLQTSGVKSLSSTDSFIGGSGTSSAALNLLLSCDKKKLQLLCITHHSTMTGLRLLS